MLAALKRSWRVVRHPKQYLDENWRWEDYRDFFNITIFRYLVLWFSVVPVLASLLSGIKTPVDVALGGAVVQIGLVVPFSWQILWLSSFFFFLAIALYWLRCPKFIRKYHHYGEYETFGHDARWLVWEIQRLKDSGAKLQSFTHKLRIKAFARLTDRAPTPRPLVEELQTVYRYAIDGEVVEIGCPVFDTEGKELKDAERGLFWELFASFSGSRSVARGLILCCLIMALGLFLFVLFEHVRQGVVYVWSWVGSWIPGIWTSGT